MFRAVRILLVWLCCVPAAFAQRGRPPGDLVEPATVIVRVRCEGAPLTSMALVKMTSTMTAANFTEGTKDAGTATFSNIPLGRYAIEVSAPGYKTSSDEIDVMLPGASSTYIIEMHEEAPMSSASQPASQLVLAPNARKELDKALDALRNGNFKAAEEALLRVMKMAPGHPDAYYLMAMVKLETQNRTAAQENLKKALQLFPDHVPSLICLGKMLYDEKSFQGSIGTLEHALQLNPDSAKAHEVLAADYLAEQVFDKARHHAARAIELSKGASGTAQLVLGMAYVGLGEREKARQQLESFITANPNHPMVARAKELLAAWNPSRSTAASASPATAPVAAEGAAAPSTVGSPARPAPPVPPPVSDEVIPPPAKWPVTPVDAYQPPMNPGAVCKLPTVLQGAGRNAIAIAVNIERIAATETVETIEDNPTTGERRYVRPRRNYYVVSIREPMPGFLAVDESRTPIASKTPPPRTDLEISGLFALGVIFHPYFAKDFDFRCEGQTQWHGEPVWSVYFKQKANRPSRVRSYKTGSGRFPVPLKGRAFVSANGYEIVRMEMNMVEPIKKIKLEHEHLAIEYEPVTFTSRKVKLWLPANSEYLSFFKGRMYHLRQRLNDYLLFNVDVGDRPQPPPAAEEDAVTKPPLHN